MNQSVLLAAAPMPKKAVAGSFDYSPKHIAEEVLKCAEEGAVMVHLHVLDEDGHETTDLSAFHETIQMIRKESDIIIQGSTGGSTDLSIEKRSASLDYASVQTASLNMGSVNFGDAVYQNPVPDIYSFAKRMKERSIAAEMEIFDLSMLYVGIEMVEKELIPPCFNFCFGFPNAMPAKKEVLLFLLNELKENANICTGILHHGSSDFSFLRFALENGVDMVRAGFEDSRMGEQDNAGLVKKLKQQIIGSGRSLYNIMGAKNFLGI